MLHPMLIRVQRMLELRHSQRVDQYRFELRVGDNRGIDTCDLRLARNPRALAEVRIFRDRNLKDFQSEDR